MCLCKKWIQDAVHQFAKVIFDRNRPESEEFRKALEACSSEEREKRFPIFCQMTHVIKNPASTPLGQLERTRPFLQKISGFEKEQWCTIELNKIHSGMRIVLNLVLPNIMIKVEKVLR